MKKIIKYAWIILFFVGYFIELIVLSVHINASNFPIGVSSAGQHFWPFIHFLPWARAIDSVSQSIISPTSIFLTISMIGFFIYVLYKIIKFHKLSQSDLLLIIQLLVIGSCFQLDYSRLSTSILSSGYVIFFNTSDAVIIMTTWIILILVIVFNICFDLKSRKK